MTRFVDMLASVPGIDVKEAALPPEMTRSHSVHATIYNKTLSYYFKKEYEKAELVSPIMNELIEQGNRIALAAYSRAIESQNRMIDVMDDFMRKYDVLISLSTAGEAPPFDITELPDPALMWTMTHLPVVSAPAFVSPAGLPFGVQIAGRKYNDYLLFRFIRYLRESGCIPAAPNPTVSSFSRDDRTGKRRKGS
jgi:Asp-tRNA(Asn)/Glu-tRNA(Gln) amidotransferase A subunit family amidase